jgi:Zn ribbon nucleic-acid-binding protein
LSMNKKIPCAVTCPHCNRVNIIQWIDGRVMLFDCSGCGSDMILKCGTNAGILDSFAVVVDGKLYKNINLYRGLKNE